MVIAGYDEHSKLSDILIILLRQNFGGQSKKTMEKESKKLLLLDGNAIVHRAYHAIPPLSTGDGVETNAVYGFTSTLLSVMEKFQPDYIVASFDVPGKTFRHEMYDDYKAKRKETPEDLVPQFDLVKDVVRSLGITIVEKEGYEADDVIGTIAAQTGSDGVETIIVTGDKDTLQLVNDHVRVFTMSRGIHDMILYDRDLVKDKMGVDVDQIVDYKGLRGDSSDNIPGVKGVGEKTAVSLLEEYKTLDNVYEHLDDIKESVRKKLETDKEKALLSRELGRIKTDVPIDNIDYKSVATQNMTFGSARKMFQKLSFTSLLKRLPEGSDADKSADAKVAVEKKKKKHVYVAEGDVAQVLKEIEKEPVAIALDVGDKQLYGFAATNGDVVHYIPYTPKTKEMCAFFLSSTGAQKIFYDAKKAMHILTKENITLAGIKADALLQAYVVQKNKKFEFEQLVFDATGEVIEEKKSGAQMALVLRDEDEEKERACMRAEYIKVLHEDFQEKIAQTVATQGKKANIATVLETIEMPLVQVLFDMEMQGIMLDKERFGTIAAHIDAELEKLTEAIYKHAGETFNINSTQQLRVILFDKLGIDATNIKKNKTGYSTASSELEKIRDTHPIIENIETYRELFKLKTTYVDVLPTLTDSESRIHTTFNQAVASTGRLSSSDPNLQNIPIRTEEGRKLREGFVAKDGYKLVSVDYSQIDLRCVAHVSGDEALINAFKQGADIHTFTAASVIGVEQSAVTKEQRSSAKELNFGLIYGMGQYGFARAAGIDNKQAKAFIEAYFERFAGVKKYIDDTKEAAKKSGYVETLFGRRRYVPEITSKNFQLKSAGERAAINMPIQGLAADIMKLAMIAVDRRIAKKYDREKVYAVLQVHDEIIFEVEESLVETFVPDVKSVMEKVCELKVPLVVDSAFGNHWGEL